MTTFYPEGILSRSKSNTENLKSPASIQEAMQKKTPLEARAAVCDSDHNLIVDLGFMKGIIPREECAIGISDGSTRDIAIISKVNKPVSFYVTDIKKDQNGSPFAVLSRRLLQERCREEYINKLIPGDIIHGKVTHLESFGCFVDIGCGIISLIPIDAISISRISHPRDRFAVGQDILAVVKSFDEQGKICLTHKELLGTWEENAEQFTPGETVSGVIRSIENYGIFVELAPNLAGLAELKENVKVGQHASVYIKSLIPEKMKIKLIIVDHFDADYPRHGYHYYVTSPHIDYWKYSPDCAEKQIETLFQPEE